MLNGLENDIDFSNQLHHSNLANVKMGSTEKTEMPMDSDTRNMINNSTTDKQLPNFHDAQLKLSDYQINASEFSKQAHYFDITNTERLTSENRVSNNYSKNA